MAITVDVKLAKSGQTVVCRFFNDGVPTNVNDVTGVPVLTFPGGFHGQPEQSALGLHAP
jgi:hypothetical protein